MPKRSSSGGTLVLATFCLMLLLCSILLYAGEAKERAAERSIEETGAELAEEPAAQSSGDSERETKKPVGKTKAKLAVKDTTAVARHAYAGVSKCKMCHMPYFKAWSSTPHATAVERLSSEKKQDKNPKCLKCHTTGFGLGGYEIGKDTPDLANVQCEACHGPGADYRAMSTMKDREKARVAGLVFPVSESVCLKCHNEESPSFEGFDFKKYVAKGVHKMQKQTTEKKQDRQAGDNAGK